MTEDPLDDRGLFDERDQAQAPTTARAIQYVKPEGSPHQVRPSLPTRSTRPRHVDVSRSAASA